jgi:2-polyprenyl-3-methyl-5-hydroxy-6-metoxy-1,4-benzoquinol methylase
VRPNGAGAAAPGRAGHATHACWACGAPAVPLDGYGGALHRCTECDLAFQPGRSRAEVGRLYDAAYLSRQGLGAEAAGDRVFDAAVRLRLVQRYARSGRLLEVGTGGGYFLAAAADAGFDAVGLEPAAEAARDVSERVGVPVAASALEDAELEPASFDVACAWHVVEHLVEPLPALAKLRAALRPGGHVLVELPNFAGVRARRDRERWPPLDLEHHVGQYGPRSLRALLERAGLADVDVTTVPFATYRRPARALLSHAKHAVLLRGWPAGPHPWKHDLLRAVARRPHHAGQHA